MRRPVLRAVSLLVFGTGLPIALFAQPLTLQEAAQTALESHPAIEAATAIHTAAVFVGKPRPEGDPGTVTPGSSSVPNDQQVSFQFVIRSGTPYNPR